MILSGFGFAAFLRSVAGFPDSSRWFGYLGGRRFEDFGL